MAAAHMFSGASNLAISGGMFINHMNSGKSGLERLSAAAAHSALHDAPARTDATRCLQDTRTNILDHLERWAQGLLDEDASIFWLHGGAGAGKSAVMQTLAERFVAEGLALGSFFFSRDDKTRNTAEVLIPTLVYQLAQLFPAALEVLDPLINRDPLIFNKNLQVQLLNLLVEPLKHLTQLGSISDTSQSPCVFLIDGLDECGDPTQQQAIIQAAAAVCHQHRIPVKFLIASRPELAISTSFGLYEEEYHVLDAISLSEDNDAHNDILYFINAEFSKICSQHPFKRMIPSGWPDRDDIDRLVRKSSSHFIYASTVMKFLWSTKENPVRSLQIVQGLQMSRTTLPFAELDSLYNHILASSVHLENILQLLAFCVYAALRPSLPLISFMLDCSQEDLHIYLAEITPLAAVVFDHEPEVILLHASLGDFLRDTSRAGSLYINEEDYLASKLDKCFQLMAIHSTTHFLDPDADYRLRVDRSTYQSNLLQQIKQTIEKAGSLIVTQQVLGQLSFLQYFEWLLKFRNGMVNALANFTDFFFAVHSVKTSEGVTVFKDSAEDFFNTLDTHITLKKHPLVAALFRLIIGGYNEDYPFTTELILYLARLSPETMTRESYVDEAKVQSGRFDYVWTKIQAVQIASVQHDLDTSSGCLLVAATEGILRHLFNDDIECKRTDADALYPISLVPWLLSRASVSEKIAPYSNRAMILRHKYQEIYFLIDYFADYLDEYHIRVLQELDWRIVNGDVNALIEKSRLYLLNDQD